MAIRPRSPCCELNCLHPARVLLKANDLQLKKRHFRSHGKTGIVWLLASLILLLNAMAACPALHELIHHDADSDEHHCAVTMFTHGQVDSATVDVSVATPPVSIESTPQIVFSVFTPAIENLPAGRAPPVCSAVS
jgi:hypothetical protein